jgi:pimeloyl-ACP methyl ester carboxylesterase
MLSTATTSDPFFLSPFASPEASPQLEALPLVDLQPGASPPRAFQEGLSSPKPLFIFLPGMDGTGQLLRTQGWALAETFDIRCLSLPPDGQQSWEQLVASVIALVRAELKQIPRPAVYLCGESFGGCLSLKLCQAAPELFQAQILANPASSFSQRQLLFWGSSLVRWLPALMYRGSAIALLPFLAALERIAPSDRHYLLTAMQTVPQQTSIWRIALLSQFQLSDAELQKIHQPTLIIAGAADRLLPSVAEAKRLMKLLPQANLTILPYSGHACLIETDINLADILAKNHFLSQFR